MGGRSSHENEFRQVQQARIARWFSDGVEGFVFRAGSGKGYFLLEGEAEAMEQEANKLIDECITGSNSSDLNGLTIACILAIMIAAGLGHYLIAGAFPAFSPASTAIGYTIPLIIGIIMWPLRSEIRYEYSLRKWRRAKSNHLYSLGRKVGSSLEQSRRRINLFRLISSVLAIGLGIDIYFGISSETGSFSNVHICLIALLVLMAKPADWVDETHRRRRWRD